VQCEVPAIDLERIEDPGMRQLVGELWHLVHALVAENTRLREENAQGQRRVRELEAEVRRLKNLPPRPPQADTPSKHSTERHRKESKGQGRGRPSGPRRVGIDTTQRCQVDRRTLPSGAVFRGYIQTVVQEIELRRNNTCFEREQWYDPSTGRTITAPLPTGFAGHEFGPQLRATVLMLHGAMECRHARIREFLQNQGIAISEGEIARILVHDLGVFRAEHRAVHQAGLQTATWIQMDDTSTRVNGKDRVCFVVGDDRFTTFDTREGKDRLTTLCALYGEPSPHFAVDEGVLAQARAVGVPAEHLERLRSLPPGRIWDEAAFETVWNEAFEQTPSVRWVGARTRKLLRELCAHAGLRRLHPEVTVPCLLADDGGNDDALLEERALCWIHEGRLYEKLVPGANVQAAQQLEAFQTQFWGLYRQLLAYKKAPSPPHATALRIEFDRVVAPRAPDAPPRWEPLRLRIEATRAKQDELLRVLDRPEVPLHNNASELAARQRVRKRDVRFGPRSEAGRRAWDVMQSVVATAKKLGLSVLAYLADRVRGTEQIPPLATLVRARGLLPTPAS
jgi:hypothetical protein